MLLEWDDPGDPSVTHWEYKQRQADEPFGDDWTFLPKDATPTSFLVPSLEIGASYAFKLRAVNAGGAGAETGEVTVTLPLVPARPKGLVAEPGPGVNEVSLEWTALDDPSVILWQYRFKTTGKFEKWVDIPDSNAGTTDHRITGLEGGTPTPSALEPQTAADTASKRKK